MAYEVSYDDTEQPTALPGDYAEDVALVAMCMQDIAQLEDPSELQDAWNEVERFMKAHTVPMSMIWNDAMELLALWDAGESPEESASDEIGQIVAPETAVPLDDRSRAAARRGTHVRLQTGSMTPRQLIARFQKLGFRLVDMGPSHGLVTMQSEKAPDSVVKFAYHNHERGRGAIAEIIEAAGVTPLQFMNAPKSSQSKRD